VNIELDGIPLILVERDQAGGTTEVRNVSHISTSNRRSLVEHRVLGMEGSLFQDMGRAPVRISFEGSIQGKNAKERLEALRSKFRKGLPVPFSSDISGATDIPKVLMEDLKIEDMAGVEDKYWYTMVLLEYLEPPPEPQTPPTQDEEAHEWSEETAEDAVDSVNYLEGQVEGNEKSNVKVIVTGEDSEFSTKTDGDGRYRIDELPPGKYSITIDSEEYTEAEEEIIIGSDADGGEEAEDGG
jgi:hypothetical protein